jgi:hypothetical protein
MYADLSNVLFVGIATSIFDELGRCGGGILFVGKSGCEALARELAEGLLFSFGLAFTGPLVDCPTFGLVSLK